MLVAFTSLFDRDAHRPDSPDARRFHNSEREQPPYRLLACASEDAQDRNLSCVLRLTGNGKLLRQFVVQTSVWTKLLFGL
jgi:hypothetical protein